MAVKDLLIKVGVIGAKKAEKQVKGVDGALDKLGSVALKVSGAFFAAKGLISGMRGVVEAAGRQEQAEKALQTALGRTSKALLEQASALQKVSVTGDEAIIEQQAFLASLKFTEDQIKTIIPVALDLSAATGISLESAVRNTAKTFSGLSGELGELVPQLRDLTAEEMKAGEAVTVLGNLFSGQALAQTDTYFGSVEQLKNEIGDLAEDIGEILIPAFLKLTPHIRTAVEMLGKVVSSTKGSQEQTTKYSEKIAENNQMIEVLTERTKGLTSANIFENRHTEQVQNLLERARQRKESTVELLRAEKTILGNLIAENSQLALQHEAELEFQEKFGDSKKANLQIIKATADTEINTGAVIKKVNADHSLMLQQLQNQKKRGIQEDIRGAIISGQSAEEAMRSVVRAELMEAISGLVSSILKSFPFPVNLAIAAGAGALATSALERNLASASKLKFADGGIVPGYGSQDTVPAMLTPGEVILNQAQQENLVRGMGVTVNIQGNVFGTREFVRDTLVPEIERAVRFA
tara:strand:- start:5267 stop:6835 length:1569 start_codon:yes stop_codon:yes gene_type:complete